MDFPSSKRFWSPAGQIQPQHAWLRTAAAHPQQLQPGGGEGRNPLEEFTVTNALSLSGLYVWQENPQHRPNV